MFRLTLRSVQANLTRLVLSSLAIVLGVAFVAGSMMFTDGLAKAMSDLSTEPYRNIDIQVSPGRDSPADLADRVRAVPGVRAAEGESTVDSFGIATRDGKRLAYPFATSLPIDPALRRYDATRGRLPAAPGEVVLDERTASDENIAIGDEVRIGNETTAAKPYRVVGTIQAAKDPAALRGVFVGMVLRDAMELDDAKLPSRVIVATADGVSDAELVDRIRAVVGDGEVQTHDQLVREAMNGAVGNARTFKTALLGFGVIAVLVAAFVIANTFTIVLAQRTRETALLRLVGATRRQVFRSLVGEALVLGLIGSLLGLMTGVGLAYGLRALFAALGLDLRSPLVINGSTVAVALAVGTGVTVLSALLPARRGTRVAPVTALSDAAVEVARKPGRVRRVLGALAAAAGVAALFGATTTGAIELVIVGIIVAFIGFLLLSPTVVPVFVRLLGWPAVRLAGAAGKLAVANSVRNPRRIAATTNALVIGVTLVSTITLVSESAKAPAEHEADRTFAGRFLVAGEGSFAQLPSSLIDAVRRQPELRLVHSQYQGQDDKYPVYSGHPALLARTYPDAGGSVAELAAGTAVVAEAVGVPVGGTVTVGQRPFRVVATVPRVNEKDTWGRDNVVWLTTGDLLALDLKPSLDTIHVDPAPGVPATAAKAALERMIADYPTMLVYDHEAYVARLNRSLDQGLAMVTGLLALAVIIALIGVANTLTLSVVERTRENALLRAIGFTRRQLRGTLSAEALVMALTGTIIGVGAGIGIALSMLGAITAKGGEEVPLTLPWSRLGLLFGIAALAALAASVMPARRAVRRPVVESLAAE